MQSGAELSYLYVHVRVQFMCSSSSPARHSALVLGFTVLYSTVPPDFELSPPSCPAVRVLVVPRVNILVQWQVRLATPPSTFDVQLPLLCTGCPALVSHWSVSSVYSRKGHVASGEEGVCTVHPPYRKTIQYVRKRTRRTDG